VSTYPDDGLCSGHPEPWLWDGGRWLVPRETKTQREARQGKAIAVCRQCPVRVECAQAVDPDRDEGVRAGVVLPPLDKNGRPVPGYGPVQGIGRRRAS